MFLSLEKNKDYQSMLVKGLQRFLIDFEEKLVNQSDYEKSVNQLDYDPIIKHSSELYNCKILSADFNNTTYKSFNKGSNVVIIISQYKNFYFCIENNDINLNKIGHNLKIIN